MSKDSTSDSRTAALHEMMEGVSTAVALFNGIKAGLVNEGWDPKRAERLVVAEFERNAIPPQTCRSCGNNPTEEPFK